MTKRLQALITGSTSGIGFELARRFAKENYDLLLLARNKKKLELIKHKLEKEFDCKVIGMVGDLSDKLFLDKLARFFEKKEVSINVLVNDAGFGDYGYFVGSSVSKQQEMILVNVFALTTLTRLVLPTMLKHKSGLILNVSSVAGFMPGPMMATYFATKNYVNAFSSALREEVKPFGIQVSTLCPGPTKTNFDIVANDNGTESLFDKYMSVENVCDITMKSLKKGKRCIIPGFKNKLLVWLVKLLPEKTVVRIVKSLEQKNHRVQEK